MRKIGLLLLSILAYSTISYSIPAKIDSLSEQLKNHSISDSIRVNILNELAFEYIHENAETLRDYIRESQKITNEIDYPRGAADALAILAVSFWIEGQLNFALDYYLQALKLYEDIGDKIEIHECYKTIGNIYKKLEEYDLSLIYQEQALDLSTRYLPEVSPLFSYLNIAEIYLITSELEMAKDYFEKALILSVEEANMRAKSYAYAGLGQIYNDNDDKETGLFYLEKSLELGKKTNDILGIIKTSILIGEVYVNAEKYKLADEYYKEALAESQGFNAIKHEIRLHKMLFSLDSIQGNFKNALIYNYRYNYLKDSLYSIEKENQLARIKTIYEVDKKDKANALLLKDKEANEKIQQYQKLMNIGGIFVLWILGVMSIALFRQLKQQKKNHKLLQIKNEEINNQKNKLLLSAQTLKDLNENLEKTVKERTGIILKKNKKLSEFAYMNAHNVRGPLSNILGLTYLLKKLDLKGEQKELISHLNDSAEKLDTEFHQLRTHMENEERS